jgi:energy-converting hydrogenase Eha subunit E
MNKIKQFLTNKDTEAWAWMTVNSFIVLVGTYLADINPLYSAPIIAMINVITKFLNTKYIKQ